MLLYPSVTEGLAYLEAVASDRLLAKEVYKAAQFAAWERETAITWPAENTAP